MSIFIRKSRYLHEVDIKDEKGNPVDVDEDNPKKKPPVKDEHDSERDSTNYNAETDEDDDNAGADTDTGNEEEPQDTTDEHDTNRDSTDYNTETDDEDDAGGEEEPQDTTDEHDSERDSTDYNAETDDEDNIDDTGNEEDADDDDRASTDYGSESPDDENTDTEDAGEDTGDGDDADRDSTDYGSDMGEDGGDTGGEDTGEGEATQTTDDLQNLETQIFSNLSPEKISIKNIELKKQCIDLYDVIVKTITRVNKIPKTDVNVQVLEYIIKKLTELKDLVNTNITQNFNSKTYFENLQDFHYSTAILNSINDILEELGKVKEDSVSSKKGK